MITLKINGEDHPLSVRKSPSKQRTTPEAIRSGFNLLKSDPGRIGLASVEREVTKLNRIRELNLPDGLWSHASPKLLDRERTFS
jgi:hypothetical protein